MNQRYIVLILLSLIAVAVLTVRPWQVSFAATFTVDSTADSSDINAGDGICDDGAGNCTLRAAIEEANASAGHDAVHFSIGSGIQTITPSSSLPVITDSVTIDGTSQPGFSGTPVIELDGSGAGSADGLRITAGNSRVRAMVINRFEGQGILIQTNGGNTIIGNYIGTDITGTLDLGNAFQGVRITGGSQLNIIGGATVGERNIISGNDGNGVEIIETGALVGKIPF